MANGNVEGVIGFGRRNFLVPMPRFESFEALNAWLEEQCLKRQDAVLRGHSETIGARLLRDLRADGAAAHALRRLREGQHPGHVDLDGALPRQRLLGAGCLCPSRGPGLRICRRGRDRRRHGR